MSRYDISLFRVRMSPNLSGLKQTLSSGWIGEGRKVSDFEGRLAGFFGAQESDVVTTNSCTSAIQLSFQLG